MTALLVRMVFSLAVVVGLLIVISRVAAKRFQGRSGSPIEVLHRQALSKSASVSVVSVAGRVLVLGTTDQQVSVLTELDADTFAEAEAGEEPAAAQAWDLEDGADEALELDPATYGEPLTVPSLEALLAEPDLVTLEELFGHRPPATAAAPSFDTAPAPAYAAHPAVTALQTTLPTTLPTGAHAGPAATDPDPVLPEDPSYAAFAAELRARIASGSHAGPGTAPTTAPVTAPVGVRSGRHAAPVPALEMPPAHTGGARAARVAPPAPAPIAPAPSQPSLAGVSAADLAHLRAALLAAQVQAGATGTPQPAPVAPATRPAADGALAGSVLSPSTWRQAFRAVNRRAS